MKKYLSALLAFLMTLTVVLPVNLISYSKENNSSENIVRGEFNYGIDYELNYNTGVFTVTGNGKAFSGIENMSSVGEKYCVDIDGSKVTKVVFSEGITLICSNPIRTFENLKEVTLPKSLKRVLRGTFPSDIKIDTINYGGNSLDWNRIQIDNQDDTNNGLKNVKKINFSSKVPAAPGSAEFKDKVTKKWRSDDMTCTLNYYTGVVEVSGKTDLEGEFVFYDLNEEPVTYPPLDCDTGYFPLVNDVVIKSGPVRIGEYFLHSSASSITIPKSVKEIDANNFDYFDYGEDYDGPLYRGDLKDIYYGGTIVDWKNIKFGEYNYLSGIKIHYAEKVSAKELKYSLSKTSYAYDGKTHTPTVTVKDKYGRKLKKNTDYTVTVDKVNKKVGKYKMVIKLKGEYQGQKTMYYTIKPKSTSITKLTAGKKKLTAKWKKQVSQTTGYQLQYSTDKSFKKNNKTVTVSKNKITSKTISKLKAKKKYYVRVRTYKTVKVNGKSTKIYSSWSKAKAVTIK
ncbi:MAG: fibronectin type III domain-containing protein [Clostridiales bacterium]|nr:fibronectin type III domain-containing protein [Clostridiales bacterium]